MITHVIFDLSEVLLTGIKDSGIDLGKKHGVDFSTLVEGPVDVKNPLMIPAVWKFFHGDMTEDQYVAEVLRAYPQFGSHNELKRYIRENFVEVEGTRSVVTRLRKMHYTLALLSVHGREWIEYCNNLYDIHSLFDLVVYSYMDKVSKPQPEAFTRMLARLDAEPQECLFIDDSAKNVTSARELGITAIRFTHAAALREELDKTLPGFSNAR